LWFIRVILTNDDKPLHFTRAKYKETVIELNTIADFKTIVPAKLE